MEEKTVDTCVIVKLLEIGHKANIRSKPTVEGFTHDWTIFVRGAEGSNIQHYVERVVFHLHESFPKPKRVVKEPPYQVCESGYAGFMINIEVHFRSKEDPKKVFFNYDLYLHLEGPPISYCRAEKVIFQNPTEDFRRKLLRAGGVGIHGPEGGTVLNTLQKPSPSSSNSNSHGSSQSKPTKHVSEAIKQPKSSTGSTSTAPSVNTTQTSSIKQEVKNPPVSQPPQTFLDLFGQPIKTSKASPDPQRVKDLHSKSSSKSSKPANSNSFASDHTSNNSNNTKDIKPSFSKETKDLKEPKKDKSAEKRPPSPSLSATGDASLTKKRKTVSSSSGPSKHKDSKDKKKSEKKNTSKDKEKKEKRDKHKHGSDVSHTKHLHVERKYPEEKSCKEAEVTTKIIKKTKQPPSPSLSNSSASSETKSSRSNKVSPPSPDHTDGSFRMEGDASPSSSISLSPMHHGRGQGPLGALMAAYEGGVLSPMSSDSSGSPTHVQQDEDPVPVIHSQPTIPISQVQPVVSSKTLPPHLIPPEIVEKPKVKEEKSKVREEKFKSKEEKHKVKEEKISIKNEKTFSNKEKEKRVKKSRNKIEKISSSELSTTTTFKKESKGSTKEHRPAESVPNLSLTEEYATELKELQRQIMTLRDRKHLQQIVNVIEETGLYQEVYLAWLTDKGECTGRPMPDWNQTFRGRRWSYKNPKYTLRVNNAQWLLRN